MVRKMLKLLFSVWFFLTASPALATKDPSLINEATQLSLMGKNEEARDILLGVIEREPNNFMAYNNLGLVYVLLEDYDLALETYKKGLQVNPTFSNTLNNIGHLYLIQGDLDQAEHYLKQALINPSPGFPPFIVMGNLGEVYLNQKRYDEAEQYLEKALVDMPEAARFHRLLAQVYQETGREQDARREMDRFNQIQTSSQP